MHEHNWWSILLSNAFTLHIYRGRMQLLGHIQGSTPGHAPQFRPCSILGTAGAVPSSPPISNNQTCVILLTTPAITCQEHTTTITSPAQVGGRWIYSAEGPSPSNGLWLKRPVSSLPQWPMAQFHGSAMCQIFHRIRYKKKKLPVQSTTGM